MLAMMGLIGFAAWNSGTNLVYLMFALLIAFFLVHGSVVWVTLLRIDVERTCPPHVTAMKEAPVTITVRNRRRRFPSYGLQISDHLAGNGLLGIVLAPVVPAGGTRLFQYCALFPRRGLFVFHHLRVSTRFPFGFAERSTKYLKPAEVLVYPRMFDISEALLEMSNDLGDRETRQRGLGTDLYGLREYVDGEHTKRIHWKSSAKARRLMVMEHERDEQKRSTIRFDNYIPASARTDRQVLDEFEKAVSFTASIARQLVQAGHEVALETASGGVPFGSGTAHLLRIMRTLALIEPARIKSVLPMPRKPVADFEIRFREGIETGKATATRLIDVRSWEVINGRLVRTAMS